MSYYSYNPLWDFFEAVANQVDSVQQQQQQQQGQQGNQRQQRPQRQEETEEKQPQRSYSQAPSVPFFGPNVLFGEPATKPAPVPAPQPVFRPQPKAQVIQPLSVDPEAFLPPIDVYDTEKEYKIFVSVPGARKQTTEVHYNPETNQLFIEGEVEEPALKTEIEKSTKSKNGPTLLLSERQTGTFARILHLPADPKVDHEAITAKYKAGVLEVTVPKKSNLPVIRHKITVEDVDDEELVAEAQGE